LIFYFESTACFIHFNTIDSILNSKAFDFAFVECHLTYFFDQQFNASNDIGSNFDCEHFDSLRVN
jgi:hypothetical protein